MDPAIPEFVAAFADALRESCSVDADSLGPFLTHLDGFNVTAEIASQGEPRADHPALAHLPSALAAAAGTGQDRLLVATGAVVPLLDWSLFYAKEGWGADLADRMVAGEVVGPWGLVASRDFIAGLFLLAPEVRYPPHGHAAWEVYYILSGRVDFQQGEGAAWASRGPGETILTPANLVHSLRNGAEPALILFAWHGEISAYPWYLEPGPDGEMVRRDTSGPADP